MSTVENWLEEARLERARDRAQPSEQTGLIEPYLYGSTEDEFYEDEPEDEELDDES